MKIALDGRTVYAPARRGTGKNLVDVYRRVADLRPDWEIVILHRGQGSDDPFAGIGNISNRSIEVRGDRFNLWQQVRLPLAARREGASVLHCPANTGARWPLVPMVVTIHDLIPLDPTIRYPEAEQWGRNVGAAARKARRIITPSQYSKEQIVATFGVSADKIIVNHWAADDGCTKVEDSGRLDAVRLKYGLERGRPFVLGFGADDPRKNTERVLASWARLPERLRREYALVIVGMQEASLVRFRRQAEGLGLAGGCFLHGFAPEEDIAPLLSAAVALCYPSLSEGFGLPLLDAFACDSAVLTSDRTSLPEVAGDAALLVDPTREEAIASGLEGLLADRAMREELVRRGRARLGQFTWQACAERMCRAFEEACG